jgi:hypothetical protein
MVPFDLRTEKKLMHDPQITNILNVLYITYLRDKMSHHITSLWCTDQGLTTILAYISIDILPVNTSNTNGIEDW